jgi:predicted NBD/HSP70 family sugar kinase
LAVAAIVKRVRTADRQQPIRQRSLRDHNLGLVLRQVSGSTVALSRADIATATGLTRATVSTLVGELLGSGFLTEVAPSPRTRTGRPGTGLRVSEQGPAGLGLEVNVDYLAACVVDLAGSVRRREVRYGDQRGRDPDDVLDDLSSLAHEFTRSAAAEGVPLIAAAVGVPGLVADGVVRLAPNLGWHDVALAEGLRQRGLYPYTVDNEANLAALGELHAWGQPRASFVFVSGEIGVGGGIVLDGRLFRGARGFGGEIGHVSIKPDGAPCRCGSRGCLEAYASQEVLLGQAGLDPGPRALGQLLSRADAGDAPVLAALESVGRALGVGLSNVVNLFNVATIVLGGSFSLLARWLAPAVSRELSRRVLTARWDPISVTASKLEGAGTVVGAAATVVRAIQDDPAHWLNHR